MTNNEYERWLLKHNKNLYPTRYYAKLQRKENEVTISIENNNEIVYTNITIDDYYKYYLCIPRHARTK